MPLASIPGYRLKPEIARRIQAVLDHGQFILGPEVTELETALAKRAGAKHVVGVSSGTDALVMALMALEIGPGDEVVTSGGIYGVITNVKEDRFVVRVADNTKIEIGKGFVQAVVKKVNGEEKK